MKCEIDRMLGLRLSNLSRERRHGRQGYKIVRLRSYAYRLILRVHSDLCVRTVSACNTNDVLQKEGSSVIGPLPMDVQ